MSEIAKARLRNKVVAAESAHTPLPYPPPQGGREQAAAPARIENKAAAR
jgi:hypothetical protein